jgi:hypothetical protein
MVKIIYTIIDMDERAYNKTTKSLFLLDQEKNSQQRIPNTTAASPKLMVLVIIKRKVG